MKIFKQKKVVFFFILFFFVSALLSAPSLAAKKKRFSGISARSAIFSNATKGIRYYGKKVHMKVLPASTAKVMTALIVLERLPLDKVVTVSRRASSAPPSKIAAQPGEKFYVRELLYALLLKSANDASIALAEAVAGSEWEFVQLMNKRAKRLGATNTRFANSSGLPTKGAKQWTTAYDMYLIFKEAMKHTFFKTVIKHRYKNIKSLSGRVFKLKSHNKILFQDWKRKVYGKTGWTRTARSCFVGYVMKGQDVCIIAVFGCSRRWSDIKYIISKYGGIPL